MGIKQTITEIKDFKLKFSGRERVKALSTRMDEAAASGEQDDVIVATVCGIHILIEHANTGVLLDRDLNALVKTCTKQLHLLESLDVRGVDQLVSSFYIARSRISSAQGLHWDSGFQNLQAFNLMGSKPLGGASNKSLSFALNALRLGFGEMAIDELKKAMDRSSDDQRESVWLHLIKSLRVCAKFEEALEQIAIFEANPSGRPEVRLDLRWERACIESCQSSKFAPLVNAGSKKGSHPSGSYIIESKLWSWALGDELLCRINGKVKYLANDKPLQIKEQGFAYRAVLELEQANDEDLPISIKVQKICSSLQDNPRFPSIDREQLFLVACARWFAKNKFYQHARYCLLMYRKHSWSLTNARDVDNLRICQDLYQSKWFSSTD